jgi:3-methyladenine DNA glycosylase AlkD
MIGGAKGNRMTAQEIVSELKKLGNAGYKKTMLNHGAQEPVIGVKIEDMKKIQKRIKKDYQLALDLYDTGIYDAMYLAGLIADDEKMSKKDLQRWMKKATSPMIAEYTVPWVAAGSRIGYDLALEWIDSKDEKTAAAGWSTLGGWIATKDDAELDLGQLKQLLSRIQKTIHQQPNRVKYVMNGFVIALGSYVKPLADAALKAAEKIGEVQCEMVGDCKVPYGPDYIRKVQARGTIGKKRKSAKC